MIKGIDHIAIVVKDLEEGIRVFSKLLGTEPYHREVVEGQKVEVASFKLGESDIELVMPLDKTTGVYKFLENRGEGIHHICFKTENIREELKRVEGEGFTVIDKEPREGANHSIIAFIHPKSTKGVLVEFKEKKDE